MAFYEDDDLAETPPEKTPAATKVRKKRTVSKSSKLMKNAILKAAEQAGNKMGGNGLVSYLEEQAVSNPRSFIPLLGKVLPMEIAGEQANTMRTVTRIELVAMKTDGNKTD